MTQAGDGLVVEVDVRHLDIGRQAIGIDRKAVVVGRDLDLAGRQVFDRLVAAAVAEFEFVGRCRQRPRQAIDGRDRCRTSAFAIR